MLLQRCTFCRKKFPFFYFFFPQESYLCKEYEEKRQNLRQKQRIVCLMSDEEMRIVDRYLAKYKITNKSRWFRETILGFIHKNMEEDYPTLFGEHDMRR